MLHDFTHTGVIPVTFWKMKFQNVTATPPELNISIPLVGLQKFVRMRFALILKPTIETFVVDFKVELLNALVGSISYITLNLFNMFCVSP